MRTSRAAVARMIVPASFTVGRDLQFIRINGTIMGALVGLILYLIGLAL